jgi:OOP family OmpA-OmpF porin
MHRAARRTLTTAFAIAAVGFAPAAYAQFGALSKVKDKVNQAKAAKDDVPKPPKKDKDTKDTNDSKDAKDTKEPAAVPQKGGQPDLTAVKIDFVPGERTVFFDDFSDMAPDEPPPHWKVRGGAVSLKIGGGAHVLAPGDGVELTSPKIAVPKDFTFEIVCNCKGEIEWRLQNAENSDILTGSFQENEEQTSVSGNVSAKGDTLGDGEIKVQPGKPFTFALWAQQGRVRAYMNGERVADANQVNFAGIDHIFLQASRYRETDIVSVRIAESAPDVGSTLTATGKYVSHGITFDTDSDHLKPESAAVIKSIASALIKNPALKLAINGYTDSTGNADHNLDLSKRRATAVMGVLVSQFSIDASRLTADGFGPKDPIGSNDTPDGRAQNRRVEFVKK